MKKARHWLVLTLMVLLLSFIGCYTHIDKVRTNGVRPPRLNTEKTRSFIITIFIRAKERGWR